MIGKDDWDAASADWIAEARRTLSPPTEQEVLALYRGELSGAEAERVRELLVYYPELARIAAAPFPTEDAAALSEQELAHDWESIRRRVAPTSAHVETVSAAHARALQFWRAFAIAASVVAAVFGALLVVVRGREQRAIAELREPRRNIDSQLLLPGGSRGGANGAPIDLPRDAEEFVLEAVLMSARTYPDYRLEITRTDAKPPRPIWSTRGKRPRSDDTFEIRLSRALLAPGTYQLTIAGIDESGHAEVLGSYAFRVPRP